MREREAGKLHDMHQRKKESLTPLEPSWTICAGTCSAYILTSGMHLSHHQSTPDKTLLLCDIMCLVRS